MGYAVLVALNMYLPPNLAMVFAVSAIAVAITSTVFVFQLATKLYGSGTGIVLGLLALIPCVGLIVLLIINSKATGILKEHGIRVGLVGASPSDIK